MLKRFVFAVVALLCLGTAQARIEIPTSLPQELVVDYAGTLSAEQRAQLSAKLLGYYVASSNVVVVTTIPSLEAVGQPTLQNWNMKLADTWKPGNAHKDNGVIVTILGTKAPYKVRINPGYGLEGILTDKFLKGLIEDVMKPVLNKPNSYYDGIIVAVDGLANQIAKEPAPMTKEPTVQKETRGPSSLAFLGVLGAVLSVIVLLFLLLARAEKKSSDAYIRSLRSLRTPPRPYTSSSVRRSSESSRVRSQSSSNTDWTPTTNYSNTSGSSDSGSSFSVDSGGGFSGGGAGD